MAAGEKSDNTTMNQRISDVYRLLINGYSSADIVQNSSLLEEWGVSERQMRTYIARARKLLEEESERTRPVELGKAVTRFEKWLRKMENIGDYRGCIAAQKEIGELMGLYKAQLDITSNGKELIEASPLNKLPLDVLKHIQKTIEKAQSSE